ncbi:hypothetical protein [Flavonifractor plautii]|uniref:hypothetical protein n=1 Tax=Flavonifractor plautii TaxID=292800 RepID=UPI0018AC83E3|nr:hypothetical protein [Flavonifractor plautii]
MEEKLSIDTALGSLCASIGGDPNYPEIFVYLKRPDGAEIDLVAASVAQKEREVSAYLYGNTSTEEWTRKHIWTQDEINICFD